MATSSSLTTCLDYQVLPAGTMGFKPPGARMIFDRFQTFVEQSVLPAKQRNPDHFRLDGETGGGNCDIFGKFCYRGQVWKVHADTHYEPLLLAYAALSSGETDEPFDEVVTA